jgi:hypothetical protein
VGTRPSSSAGHHCRRQRLLAVCAGWAEHRRCSDASAQPTRACGPSTAGTPLQHPDVGGVCRRAEGGKLRITPPARGLLSNRWGGGRLAVAKSLSPPAARMSTPSGSRRRGSAAPRPGIRLAAPPPGAWPARAQL